MKHIYQRHGYKLGLAMILLSPLLLMQNCTPSAMPANYVSATGATSLSSSSLAGYTISPLTAAYQPSAVNVGGEVMISGVGGMPPYTYKLITTGGTLAANVYLATVAGNVSFLITDAEGSTTVLTINVGTASTTTTSTGATATPFPTPTTTPVPSTAMSTTLPNGTVLPRSCDEMSIAHLTGNHDYDILYGTDYQFCMVLGRFPNNAEGTYWFHGIKEGDLQASQMLPYLFSQPEFASRYNTPGMTNADFALFIVRLLVYREPTQTEGIGLVQAVGTQAQAAAQQTMINATESSAAFKAANPYLVQLQAAYQN